MAKGEKCGYSLTLAYTKGKMHLGLLYKYQV